MTKIARILVVVVAIQLTLSAPAAETLPPVIQAFCDMAFAGAIAGKAEKFNATEVVEKGVPSRRILGYVVGDHYAYLWYEHGGRGYHQHLVKFSNTKPYEVRASYLFPASQYQDIHKLINDTKFLSAHLSNQCGL
jgi:hypothetical protein